MLKHDIAGDQTAVSLPKNNEKELSWYILAFALAFMVFIIGPPFLDYKFTPYPLMHVADVFDLFTPLIVIPFYWLLFHLVGKKPIRLRENIVFMSLAGLWVLGQGMHLAANSIGHLTENMTGTDIYKLTYFYDETLGHYLWHAGVIGFSALMIYRQWRNPFTQGNALTGKIISAGILYGFTFFAMVDEGNTVPIGLPSAILTVIFLLVWGRNKLRRQPILFFSLIGYLVAIILFAIWGIWQHGFPGFFEAGIV